MKEKKSAEIVSFFPIIFFSKFSDRTAVVSSSNSPQKYKVDKMYQRRVWCRRRVIDPPFCYIDSFGSVYQNKHVFFFLSLFLYISTPRASTGALCASDVELNFRPAWNPLSSLAIFIYSGNKSKQFNKNKSVESIFSLSLSL